MRLIQGVMIQQKDEQEAFRKAEDQLKTAIKQKKGSVRITLK